MLPILAYLATAAAIGPVIAALGPLAEKATQEANKAFPIKLPGEEELSEIRRREMITALEYYEEMKKHGKDPVWAEKQHAIRQQQVDTLRVLDAWRREIINEVDAKNRLEKLGWYPQDVELLRKQIDFYPSPSDLISWQGKEVYEPDKIEKYKLDEGLDAVEKKPFYKGGVSDEQIRHFWIAHWDHPSWTQIQRFRHFANVEENPDINDDVIYDWFSLVEMAPYWRKSFISTLYDPLTRVDARRMWDLGVIDDKGVIDAYLKQGYSPEDAQRLLIFAKVERQLPELTRRYRNGWINRDTVLNALREFGIPGDRVEAIFQRVVKADREERLAKDKELTKAEIVKGIDKKVVTREIGKSMLQKLGYDSEEAEFIISINVAPDEPIETPLALMSVVNNWRTATGRSVDEIPQEARDAEMRYLEIQKEAPDSIEASDALYNYSQLLAKHNLTHLQLA